MKKDKFKMPFSMYCLSCNKRYVRGSRVWALREKAVTSWRCSDCTNSISMERVNNTQFKIGKGARKAFLGNALNSKCGTSDCTNSMPNYEETDEVLHGSLRRVGKEKETKMKMEIDDEALVKEFTSKKSNIIRVEDSDSDDDCESFTGGTKRQKISEWSDMLKNKGTKKDPRAPKTLSVNSSTVFISVKEKPQAINQLETKSPKTDANNKILHDDNALQFLRQAYTDVSDTEDEDNQ